MATRVPVDDDLAALLEEAPGVLDLDPDGPIDAQRRAAVRVGAWLRGDPGGQLAMVRSRDDSVAGVPVRWYGPDLEDCANLVVYVHGGGWMMGDPDSYDADVRLLARRIGCAVVSVDYRRTPEHPFPAALDDCVAVIRGLAEYPHRAIAVAGDSAGGNLALGACVALGGDRVIDAVLALYPVVDPGGFERESYRANGAGYLLTADDMRRYWDAYVPSGRARRDPRVNLTAADLRGFPTTVIATADYDPLRDEARDLASALVAADVDVTYLPHPGLTHGFQQMVPRIPAAGRALADVYDAFVLAFHRASARRIASAPTAH